MLALSCGTSSEYPADADESRAYLREHVVLPFLHVSGLSIENQRFPK